MTERVDTSAIERLVGARRLELVHLGLADSTKRMVFILHSQECRNKRPDLRECPFSLALDEGIDEKRWENHLDHAVALLIEIDGTLSPVER